MVLKSFGILMVLVLRVSLVSCILSKDETSSVGKLFYSSDKNIENAHKVDFSKFIPKLLNTNTWKLPNVKPNDINILTRETLKKLLRKYVMKSRRKRQATVDLPTHFDARSTWPFCKSIGKLTAQGTCLSHGIVAATGTMSDRICIHSHGRLQPILSAQDAIECCGDECGQCSGSEAEAAFKYWQDQGIVTGGDFNSNEGCKPYFFDPQSSEGVPPCDPSCRANYTVATYAEEKDMFPGRYMYNINDANSNEQAMMREIWANGPIVARFTLWSDFLQYTSGVYNRAPGAVAAGRTHAKIIGWGEVSGIKYWVGVNSYTDAWGYQGVFKYIRGANSGGIESLGMSTGMPMVYRDFNLAKDTHTDIVFVIDTAMVNNNFISAIGLTLGEMQIQEEGQFNVGFVFYGTDAEIRLDITTFLSQAEIFARFANIFDVTSDAGVHRSETGIDLARDMLTKRGRIRAAWLILLFVAPTTEPINEEDILSSAKKAREEGVLVSVVGQGNIDRATYSRIASRDLSHFYGSDVVPDLPQHRLAYDLPIFLDTLIDGVSSCYRRMINNGLHLHQVYGECDTFYNCRYAEDPDPVYQSCPLGLLWDTDTLVCNWPAATSCRTDPCRRDVAIQSYALTGSCRLYWTCNNERTSGYACCEEGNRYDSATEQCVPDSSCQDSCKRTEECPYELYLDFADGNIQDTSYNFNNVDNYGQVVSETQVDALDGWASKFSGFQHLTVPFFANNWYGNKLDIHVRFLPQVETAVQADLTEIIVTNGDVDGFDPTIFIGYKRFDHVVVATLVTYDTTIEMQTDVLDTRYVYICLTYDGALVRLRTRDGDGFPFGSVRRATGNVKRIHNAFHIGGKDGSTFTYTNFHGHIDKFWVSRCNRNDCE